MDRSRILWRELALVAVVAVAQIGGVALATRRQDDFDSLSLWAAGLLTVPIAAVPLRLRAPVLAGWVALAGTWVYWLTDTPRGPVFFALIVVFAHLVVSHRRPAAATLAATGLVAFSMLGPWIRDGETPVWWAVAALAGWLITLFAVAELIRERRDRRRAAEQTRAATADRHLVAERLRIARDLHDVVAHHMSVVNLQAGVALHLADDAPPQVRDALATIKASSKQALGELRAILGVLRDVDDPTAEVGDDAGAPRLPTPSLGELERLIAGTRAAGADITAYIDIDHTRVPIPVQVAAYRIVQESLTNVLRHAAPTTAKLSVTADDHDVVIDVHNPTPAVPVEGASSGNGLTGMRERAESVGGTLAAGRRLAGEFTVHARLPIGSSR